MNLTIGYLYPDLMNIYGDTGNIIALGKRAQWRGIEVTLKNFSIDNKISTGEVDIFFFGGGQDQSQSLVASDIESNGKGKIIKQEIERGVPLLAICGGYQLLGEYYKPHKEPKMQGVGLFPAYAVASDTRMIGNIVVSSSITHTLNPTFPQERQALLIPYLVGFENHSGKTYLKDGAKPLGTVVNGFGNNGEDKTEGCIYKNAIGCYMHGSLLPKNPDLADWLLQKALEVKYGKKVTLKPLDDSLETQAQNTTIQRFS